MTTQVAPDVAILRREVQHKYTEVAARPGRTFHFHHGRPLAQMLRYPMDKVDALPPRAVESFAGVGNPFSLGEVQLGGTVLDVGSGSGFDCFIAGQKDFEGKNNGFGTPVDAANAHAQYDRVVSF